MQSLIKPCPGCRDYILPSLKLRNGILAMKTVMLLGSLPQYFDGNTLDSMLSERREKRNFRIKALPTPTGSFGKAHIFQLSFL